AAAAPVNAGTYTVLAHFRSDDRNYADADSPAGALVISPTTPTVTVSGGPFTYDGLPHPAVAAAAGAGSLTLTYNGSATAPSGAGSYAVLASFRSADPNFADATGTAVLVINPAAPVLTWTAPAAIISGTALDGTQLSATADVPGRFAYRPAAGTVLVAG